MTVSWWFKIPLGYDIGRQHVYRYRYIHDQTQPLHGLSSSRSRERVPWKKRDPGNKVESHSTHPAHDINYSDEALGHCQGSLPLVVYALTSHKISDVRRGRRFITQGCSTVLNLFSAFLKRQALTLSRYTTPDLR